MEKVALTPSYVRDRPWIQQLRLPLAWCTACVAIGIIALKLLLGYGPSMPALHQQEPSNLSPIKLARSYELTVGAKWSNPDGGRWKPMFVCNGQSPCPTLEAEEGDDLSLRIVNDLGAQLSIHWSGMSHREYGFWNDGTGGLNQYPILPRGNWTSRFDTTGHWGLNWYSDHTGAGVADGIYGTIWVAPAPGRSRPYRLISNSTLEQAAIRDAEKRIRHLVLWNSDFRTMGWKLEEMKGTGARAGLYCYKSILVNGKGRVFCRDPAYAQLDGVALDNAGCLPQPGFKAQPCTPTEADMEVISTNGQAYLMFNVINVGFEHALKFSIDDHRMWVVATDAGFVQPQMVDVIYVTNGARKTVLIKLDQMDSSKPDNDFNIRIASVSTLQNLQGRAILRYPGKRYPLIGQPMEMPQTNEQTRTCLNVDSSVPAGCTQLDSHTVRPFPERTPPKYSDLTLRWTAGSRESKYLEHVTEYFVNEEPWQLYRAAQKPVLFRSDDEGLSPPVQGGLPMGTVVDLIVQNELNETIPLYKHGEPTWLLGSGTGETFSWESVAEATKAGVINLQSPSMELVHDLPPLGWIVIRWKINLQGATMFHASKLKYFALGMAAPLLEGIDRSIADQIPAYAKDQPHIVFESVNDGVFG